MLALPPGLPASALTEAGNFLNARILGKTLGDLRREIAEKRSEMERELDALPANLALPAGTSPAAVTFARDWTVVVTEAGEVLVYDRAGQLRQQVAVE